MYKTPVRAFCKFWLCHSNDILEINEKNSVGIGIPFWNIGWFLPVQERSPWSFYFHVPRQK